MEDSWSNGFGAFGAVHDSTCSPIHLHNFTAVGGFPGFGEWLGLHAGVTDIYIDDSNPSVPASCDVVVTVTGCNALPVSGASVDMKVGGVIVDSGTTNAAGQVAFSSSPIGGGGAFDTVTSLSRFFTDTSSWNIFTDGLDVSVSLTPTAAYHCIFGCAKPLANTIAATFSRAGLLMLTWAAGIWAATNIIAGKTYVTSYDGSGWTITGNGISCGAIGWSVASCPPSFLGALTIPAGTCATDLGSTATVTE